MQFKLKSMRLSLILTTIFLKCVTLIAQSQTTVDTFNLLPINTRQFVTEENYFKADSVLFIRCKLMADDPNWNDDESETIFTISISNFQLSDLERPFDLTADSNRVKAKLESHTVFRSTGDKYHLLGTCTIMSLNAGSIVADFDIKVIGTRLKFVRLFRGRRVISVPPGSS